MKRQNHRIAIVAFAITMIAMLPVARAASVQAAIDAGNRKFGAAYKAGDAGAIAKLYTEQATVFPPGQDKVTGRDSIRKFWAGVIESGTKITSLETISVEQYGHAAREIGRITLMVPHAGGQPTPVSGKYVVVWKQMKGVWMLDSDIWNMNQ